MSVAVRRATRDDAPAIGRLGAGLLRAHYEFDRKRFMRPELGCDQGYASFLIAQLENPDALVLVAEDEGETVGYLYAAVEPRNWKELREQAGFVHDIYVDSGRRSAGIGEVLLDAAFAWMRDRRVPRVMLWTAWNNESARRLFDRRGFRPTMIEMTVELDE